MAHTREPDRLVDTSMVREVSFEELTDARREVTVGEPWGDDEISSLLDDAKRLIMRAVPTRFFAAFADEEIAGYCEVRSDGQVAQIEDVNTLVRFRGRGLGRAVVQEAIDAAHATSDLVYLEALADDWPRELYAKLGFDVVGERHFNTLSPHPLTRLRVRTPRLELRLGTDAELRELGRVALAGIHDPDVMPFECRRGRTMRPKRASSTSTAAAPASSRPRTGRSSSSSSTDGRPIGIQRSTRKSSPRRDG